MTIQTVFFILFNMINLIKYSPKNQHIKINIIQGIIATAIALFTLASCSKSKVVASLEEENLFSINYGSFEDQINLFDLNGVGEINTKIIMKNGFFYVEIGRAHV